MVEPRAAVTTVGFIDEYCQHYQKLFLDVRNFECFKELHLGMISEIKRKSLPAIARTVGLLDAYLLVSLHASHFKEEAFHIINSKQLNSHPIESSTNALSNHPWWEHGTTCQSALNNLRLVIQPYIFYYLVRPWLQVFKIPGFVPR